MTHRILSLLVLAIFLVLPAMAQEHDNSAYLSDWKTDFTDVSTKLIDLAGAFPADMYDWRPAEGIRSVSEAYIHVAMANFFLASNLGAEMPADWPENPEESITAKDDVIEWLGKSQEAAHGAIEKLMMNDLSSTIEVFGMEMSYYRGLMIVTSHSHEHLGQAIAYARSNGIAPPWSGGGQ